MKKTGYRCRFTGIGMLILLLMLCAGCAGAGNSAHIREQVEVQSPQEVSRQEADAQGPFYHFEITQLPNGDRNLATQLSEYGYITEEVNNSSNGRVPYSACVEGTIYRTAAAVETNEDASMMEFTPYLQVLEPPYEKWENLPLSREGSNLEQVRVTEEGKILCLYYDWTKDGRIYSVDELCRDGSRERLQEGIGEQDLDIFWERDNSVYADYFEMYSIAGSSHPVSCVDGEGKLWFGTEQKVWCYDGTEAAEILDFREEDIALKELHSMEVTADGLLFLGSFSKSDCLIQATKTDTPERTEKTEIVLADTFAHDELKDAIAAFNMQSREYRVVMRCLPLPSDESRQEQFQEELLREILQKEGPDILGPFALKNVSDAAKNGYLLPMDDFFEGKEEQFWPVAMESGILYGRRYKIPYGMMLNYIVGDGRKLPDQDSWNARELMAYVRESDAQAALCDRYCQYTADGVLLDLMQDPWDTTYIDWEKGISHLNEAPFLEMLQFVKEYSVEKYPARETCGEKLQSGEYALLGAGYQSNMDMIFQDTLYQGNAKVIGFPSVKGQGILAVMVDLCVNASTKHKEGVYEFLNYLLSDEGQMNNVMVRYPNYLPIRKETCLWMLDTKGEGTAYEKAEIHMMGVPFRYHRLQGKLKEQAIAIMENAVPYDAGYLEIQDIIREGTVPFFEGKRGLQESAEILHNRIQLYLNER